MARYVNRICPVWTPRYFSGPPAFLFDLSEPVSIHAAIDAGKAARLRKLAEEPAAREKAGGDTRSEEARKAQDHVGIIYMKGDKDTADIRRLKCDRPDLADAVISGA